MSIYKNVRVKLNERVVVFRNGLPLRALGPGRHLVWGARLTEQRWDTDTLLFRALPEVRAVLPADCFAEVTIADDARGILYRDGQPRVPASGCPPLLDRRRFGRARAPLGARADAEAVGRADRGDPAR